MRKTFLTLCFAFCFGMMFGQDAPMRQVIVVMKEQFNEVSLARSTQFMDKAQRRDFIIHEHQVFCETSQKEVMDFIGSLDNSIQDVKPFWAFNGFACKATEEAIHQLETRNDVDYIYLDEPKKMVPDLGEGKPVTSKDYAWHVNQVNAPAVWNYNGGSGYNGAGVVVAVIDSGVDYNHVDIAGSMWDGGENWPHHGCDIVHNGNDPMDDHCHGTHVAGIIAGQGVAGTQTGIAPGAKIMAIKVLDSSGYGTDSDLISGVHFAMIHGADIINLSLGDPEIGPSAVYRDLFNTVKDAGMVASVAAGNVGDTQYSYPVPFNVECPGNCPPPWLHPDQKNLISGGTSGVICVGATDSNDAHCSFSSVGPVTWAEGQNVGDYNDYPYQNGDASQPGLIRPDISAPGKNVTSLNYQTGSGYIEYDGTSMATPCVAGVLALLLQAEPELTPAELDSIIELTAAPAGNSKKNNIVGAGRIDALAAINALFHHGPTNLTANFEGSYVDLSWAEAANAVSYSLYRDGLCIANNLTTTIYTDHLEYAGTYTYYVKAQLENGLTTLPSNYITIEKPVDIQAEIIGNTRVALSWNMPSCTYDGFESGNLYQNMWINDGTSPWEITTQDSNSSSYSVRSTNKTMFSTSKITLAVNIPATTTVSYYAKIDCFPLNGGGFFIDNVQYGQTIKDKVPWTRYSVTITPGNHTLEWKYANQLSEGDYENAFYIDDITIGNPYNVYRANCDGSDQQLIAEDITSPTYIDNGWDALPVGNYMYGISTDNGLSIAWSECLHKTVMAVDEATEITGIKRITIVNTLGQVIYDASTDKDVSTSILERFPKGVYVVKLLTEQGMVSKKILKQ